ncbi:MAG: ATP-binding protein [Alphaproteobacteria bacterium]|nr:ATP-binding protein [Alphaproteobacteria bacterium]MDA8003712.1 ATP-binding protein [Alphaproteobacteria bacterium]MDA8005480.1 ATP-binding protein [Alphaproteobacteria bacterium]MDA8013304.1 ATP-binding protein [Alphaproteobacteria bacterium]
MTTSRNAIGAVVEVKGTRILLNLEEAMRSYVSSGYEGVSEVGQPMDLFVIDGGANSIVCRVEEIFFAEPKRMDKNDAPLRQMSAIVIGSLSAKEGGDIDFSDQSWKLPALGSKAYPLIQKEMEAVITRRDAKDGIVLGVDAKSEQIDVFVDLNDFLARHVAVLGSTGQGKTNFISRIAQMIVAQNQKSRLVIFDINGEYAAAFQDNGSGANNETPGPLIKVTKIGRSPEDSPDDSVKYQRIPYYALGRQGIIRLLMPSDKTQLPALRFALEHLAYVESSGEDHAVWPINKENKNQKLRDDGSPNQQTAKYAEEARNLLIQARESQEQNTFDKWPPFSAIGCLCAEWACLKQDRSGWTRDAFHYSNIRPMIARIDALVSDGRFQEVIDISGEQEFCARGADNKNISMGESTKALTEEIFGKIDQKDGHWNVHIIDLSSVATDLMPYVAGPLLEAYADELFSRGPGKTHPTLLVLEEAHHYLTHQVADDGGNSTLAYERLAKEGRKFNLSLMLSTQRPSELSSSVLSQCGTWCVMRLTNESDLRILQSASDSSDKYSFSRVSSLTRGYAYVFGNGISTPQIIKTSLADPQPDSKDASFSEKWKGGKMSPSPSRTD